MLEISTSDHLSTFVLENWTPRLHRHERVTSDFNVVYLSFNLLKIKSFLYSSKLKIKREFFVKNSFVIRDHRSQSWKSIKICYVDQGRIQEFVQVGVNFFSFQGGGLSTRWGLKTPWERKISLVQGVGLAPTAPPPQYASDVVIHFHMSI